MRNSILVFVPHETKTPFSFAGSTEVEYRNPASLIEPLPTDDIVARKTAVALRTLATLTSEISGSTISSKFFLFTNVQ